MTDLLSQVGDRGVPFNSTLCVMVGLCFHSCRVPARTCESLHVPAFLGSCSRARPSQVSSRGMLWGGSGPCCWTAAWQSGRPPQEHLGESPASSDWCLFSPEVMILTLVMCRVLICVNTELNVCCKKKKKKCYAEMDTCAFPAVTCQLDCGKSCLMVPCGVCLSFKSTDTYGNFLTKAEHVDN